MLYCPSADRRGRCTTAWPAPTSSPSDPQFRAVAAPGIDPSAANMLSHLRLYAETGTESHALLFDPVPALLCAHLRGVLAAALEPCPRLAAAGGELLFLCELEPLAGVHRLRDDADGLRSRPRHGCGGVFETTATASDLQSGDEHRAALLLQVRQLLPRIAAGRAGHGGADDAVSPARRDTADRHLFLHFRGHQL